MTTKTKIPPAPTWDLESIFPGGSSSKEFKAYRDKVKKSLDETAKLINNLPEQIDQANVAEWVSAVLSLQSTVEKIELVLAFAGCLTAQNVNDSEAHTIEAEGSLYVQEWKKSLSQIEARSLKQSNKQWEMLLADPKLEEIRFYLNEIRTIAKSKMPIELESLALDLSTDGYHGWKRIYDKMYGDLKVEFEEDGKSLTLSLGQLATRMASPDRSTRKQAFEKLVQAWESREELAGMSLNSLAGFRLNLYKNRKWDSFLFEPLFLNRLTQKSLDSMWKVIANEFARLLPYVDAKKKLLGIDKYMWYDEFSPCGKADTLYSFEEAGKFIVENVGSFSSDMADFMKMALEKRWVEAEDRADKAGGAWCSGTGPLRQTRVFMTYAGSYDNLLTLAHELGHAYHQWVLRDKAYLATDYPMNLAETASIFSETLVTDAAMSQATDPQEKLMLLEQKLQGPYVLFCDLQSRYLFEVEFYKERINGVVPTKRLRELMIDAQKKAYGPLLDESGVHPLFWCSKLHFHITEAPFYNYPYTFGFLFAGGVYDRAKKEGPAFADAYRGLLADTGSMTSEELAKKHLGVDLTTEAFWKSAVDRSLADVDTFVKLAESL